jgi:hypothetical protein
VIPMHSWSTGNNQVPSLMFPDRPTKSLRDRMTGE